MQFVIDCPHQPKKLENAIVIGVERGAWPRWVRVRGMSGLYLTTAAAIHAVEVQVIVTGRLRAHDV